MELPKISNKYLPKELKKLLGNNDAEFDYLGQEDYLSYDPEKYFDERLETARQLVEARKKLTEYTIKAKHERQKSSKENTKESKETS